MRPVSLKNAMRGLLTATLISMMIPVTATAAEEGQEASYYFSPGLGYMFFEGDDVVKDAFYINFLLGWDLNEDWSLEAGYKIVW